MTSIAANPVRFYGSPIGLIFGVLAPVAVEAIKLAAETREKRRAHRTETSAHDDAPAAPQRRWSSRVFEAGETGITYDEVLTPYLADADTVTITDPYLRTAHQIRNLGDLLESLARANNNKPTAVHIVTTEEPGDADRAADQFCMLLDLKASAALDGIQLSFELNSAIHDRSITTEAWEIDLGKGLDFWRRPERGTAGFACRRQEFREISKTFKITYTPVTA